MIEELSEAAHKMTDEISDEDNHRNRIILLGELADLLGETCPAHAKIITDVAVFLTRHIHQHDEQDDEQDVAGSTNDTKH